MLNFSGVNFVGSIGHAYTSYLKDGLFWFSLHLEVSFSAVAYLVQVKAGISNLYDQIVSHFCPNKPARRNRVSAPTNIYTTSALLAYK